MHKLFLLFSSYSSYRSLSIKDGARVTLMNAITDKTAFLVGNASKVILINTPNDISYDVVAEFVHKSCIYEGKKE